MKVTVNKAEDNLEYPYLGVGVTTGYIYIVLEEGSENDSLEVICIKSSNKFKVGSISKATPKGNITPFKGSITLSNE